jgi:hypothetical protein
MFEAVESPALSVLWDIGPQVVGGSFVGVLFDRTGLAKSGGANVALHKSADQESVNLNARVRHRINDVFGIGRSLFMNFVINWIVY